MDKYLGRFLEPVYAIMRIVVGLLFASHGAQKLLGALGGEVVTLRSTLGVAGVIEMVAGFMVAVGLLASWAAFVASGEMAVAYFTVHVPQGLYPLVNEGELAALYAFVFLFIAARGTGIWSIDATVERGRRYDAEPVD
jgi:putative oxidoreductase